MIAAKPRPSVVSNGRVVRAQGALIVPQLLFRARRRRRLRRSLGRRLRRDWRHSSRLDPRSSAPPVSGVIATGFGPFRDGQLLISVSDTGLGLAAGKAEQIFKAFFTTKDDGTGMGLPISRSIIESHAGRLWAAGAHGQGATFQFTLRSLDVKWPQFRAVCLGG